MSNRKRTDAGFLRQLNYFVLHPVEQKNYTHVRRLLGYGRYDDIDLKEMVNDLYETAWLPLRNHFTPVMKLIGKIRVGSKVTKKYDTPKTPCDRILE